MTVLSGMTGFARVSGEAEWGTWAWEAKSVNGRGLDIRVGYPQGFDVLERHAKSEAAKRFKRGSLQLSLRIELAETGVNLVVNEAALAALANAQFKVNAEIALTSEAIATLMTIKGVVETGNQTTRELAENANVMATLKHGLENVLDDLQGSRQDEGLSLSGMMIRLIEELEAELSNAEAYAHTQPTLLRDRLEKQLTELKATEKVDADRLGAEIALSAAKSDVREELDRLAAHLQSARTYLAAGSPIGRKLDFLSQELNREANTLCSKSIHIDLTNVGLALKGLVDQFKEQAANVE